MQIYQHIILCTLIKHKNKNWRNDMNKQIEFLIFTFCTIVVCPLMEYGNIKHCINCYYFHLKDERTEVYRGKDLVQGCQGIPVGESIVSSLWPHDLSHFCIYSHCISRKLYHQASVFVFLVLLNLNIINRCIYFKKVFKCVPVLLFEIFRADWIKFVTLYLGQA